MDKQTGTFILWNTPNKKNELLISATTWMNHTSIILSKRNQIQRLHAVQFLLYKFLEKAKIQK